jgi:hypothetical protein
MWIAYTANREGFQEKNCAPPADQMGRLEWAVHIYSEEAA